MALKLDITDGKGVKTRYHRIRTIEFGGGKVTVRLHSYVNQTTRDSEKNALEQNNRAMAYEDSLRALRAELDSLIGNEDAKERTVELSNQINELEMSPDRPQFSSLIDTHYSEDDVELNLPENFAVADVYTAIMETEKYKEAEAI